MLFPLLRQAIHHLLLTKKGHRSFTNGVPILNFLYGYIKLYCTAFSDHRLALVRKPPDACASGDLFDT